MIRIQSLPETAQNARDVLRMGVGARNGRAMASRGSAHAAQAVSQRGMMVQSAIGWGHRQSRPHDKHDETIRRARATGA